MAPPLVRKLIAKPSFSVIEYRCRADHHERPITELHTSYTASFVRRGSFGYSARGKRHELIPGSVLLGRTGCEYSCSHEHAIHDECLSFSFQRELLDAWAGRRIDQVWSRGALPPAEKVMVAGALAGACADRERPEELEELGHELAMRVVELSTGADAASTKEPTPADRRRAVRASELIRARFDEPLDLQTLAAEAGLSAFHFLRLFSRVLGVSPHQYLLRTRLAAAAQLLLEGDRAVTEVALDVGFGDVSSFVRTFRRAAGTSPGEFRKRARSEDRSKIFQERCAGR